MYLNLAYPQILSFHHVINIKIMNQSFYLLVFFFYIVKIWCVYFFSKTFDL